MISSMIGTWARQSPDEALRWALTNAGRLDQQAFERMADAIARTDTERALGMLDQLPPAQRSGWLTGVAQQIAQNDANRAIELVGRYRGQPEYAAAYGAVATAVARTEPARAAALMRDAPPGNSAQLTSAYLSIASQWARTDPAAAADWVLQVADPRAQQMALSQVAQAWAQRDSAGAEQWLRGLSPGATRDQAASSLLTAVAQTGRFDSRMLDLFSTERASQSAMANAIRAIGRTNEPEARRLLDAHITDERTRQSILDYLARSGGFGTQSGSTLPLIL
jgi:hypothetical protein